MEPNFLFTAFNTLAMFGWLFLFLLPKKQITQQLLYSGFWPGLLAILYAGSLSLAVITSGAPSFSSMDNIRQIFSSDWGVLTGWVHYLCFDLLVGIWITRNAQQKGIPHGWIIIPLFFTFMLGRVGWMMYMIIRRIKAK